MSLYVQIATLLLDHLDSEVQDWLADQDPNDFVLVLEGDDSAPLRIHTSETWSAHEFDARNPEFQGGTIVFDPSHPSAHALLRQGKTEKAYWVGETRLVIG